MPLFGKDFTITTVPVTALASGTVRAVLGFETKTATLKVRPIGVKSVALSPDEVVHGSRTVGTVVLECAAPDAITVNLVSGNPAVAAPSVCSITIPASSTTGSFAVTTSTVSAITSATISATANGIGKSDTLTVYP
jgi:hypothetical protein